MTKHRTRARTSAKPRIYPKPGPVGGRLIREVIAFLRESGVELPIASHILIGVSGGSDSTALAHLLLKYGRRVGDSKRIHLLHVNHRWRAGESDADEKFVRDFAKRMGATGKSIRLKAPSAETMRGDSWEERARTDRKKIFVREAKALSRKGEPAVVLTAHQANDLAETLVWRIFTGAADTHGAGITVRSGVELRPLLRVKKRDLEAYLREESEIWRDDSTNFGGRFLRSRIRAELMPILEGIFPKAVDHLVTAALRVQKAGTGPIRPEWGAGSPETMLGMSGVALRKAHWQALQSPKPVMELQLPGGWTLLRRAGGKPTEQWILERSSKV